MKLLATKQGCPIYYDEAAKTIITTARAMVDSDGPGGSLKEDPDWQAETSYRHNGASLNAHEVPYIVLPPDVIKAVPGVILGCKAQILHTRTGKFCTCVVGDIGPKAKIGEISVQAAKRIGVNPSPTRGGEDEPVIEYRIWPGVPAEVDGVTYTLQRFAA